MGPIQAQGALMVSALCTILVTLCSSCQLLVAATKSSCTLLSLKVPDGTFNEGTAHELLLAATNSWQELQRATKMAHSALTIKALSLHGPQAGFWSSFVPAWDP